MKHFSNNQRVQILFDVIIYIDKYDFVPSPQNEHIISQVVCMRYGSITQNKPGKKWINISRLTG